MPLDLKSVIARFASSDGTYETAIDGLRFHRYSHPTRPLKSTTTPTTVTPVVHRENFFVGANNEFVIDPDLAASCPSPGTR
jgi:hypothetical protein